MADVDANEFRGALGRFATGVTIVTTHSGGNDVGLTANSFSSVSLAPPMVLWSLSRQSSSLGAFMQADHFAVHVLASGQVDLSRRFSQRDGNRFAGLALQRGPGNVPLLEQCAARFQCRTAYRYDGGDHVIFVGEVLRFDHADLAPLVFHRGRYAITAAKVAAETGRSEDAQSNASFGDGYLIQQLGRAYHQLFMQLQRTLSQHGLAPLDWYVLTTLANSSGLTQSELQQALAYTGMTVTYDHLAALAAASYIQMTGAYDPGTRVTLTASGQQAVIELVAAAKAAESSAEQDLGADEIRLLKQWLAVINQKLADVRPIPSAGLE